MTNATTNTPVKNVWGLTREQREAELRRMAAGFPIYQLWWYCPKETFVGVTDEQAIQRVLHLEFVERRQPVVHSGG